jgi:hypothetical protein
MISSDSNQLNRARAGCSTSTVEVDRATASQTEREGDPRSLFLHKVALAPIDVKNGHQLAEDSLAEPKGAGGASSAQ